MQYLIIALRKVCSTPATAGVQLTTRTVDERDGRFPEIFLVILSLYPQFQAVFGSRAMKNAQSSLCPLQDSLPGHPQVRQCKQRAQLRRRVLGQPQVAHFGKAKLTLDDTKRMLALIFSS